MKFIWNVLWVFSLAHLLTRRGRDLWPILMPILVNGTGHRVYIDSQWGIMDQVLQVDSTPVLSQVPETAVTHWRREKRRLQDTTPLTRWIWCSLTDHIFIIKLITDAMPVYKILETQLVIMWHFTDSLHMDTYWMLLLPLTVKLLFHLPFCTEKNCNLVNFPREIPCSKRKGYLDSIVYWSLVSHGL